MPRRIINDKIYGCNCCPTKKKTHAEFLEELGQECLKEYAVLENYMNIDTPIRFKHLPCGTEFSLSPYKFITQQNKRYCPICYYKKSNSEINIAKYLTANNIDYQKEFIFPGLPLKRFDFYLPDYKMCIEFDGEQHFHAIPFFGGEEALQKNKDSDAIKNEFCLQKN